MSLWNRAYNCWRGIIDESVTREIRKVVRRNKETVAISKGICVIIAEALEMMKKMR